MPKTKKADIHELIEAADKAFRYIYKHMATKKDLKDFARKEDLEGMGDRVVNRVVITLRADNEQLISSLQGAHEDELASVEGRKDAPPQWRTMPVRLKMAEKEIDKIKDHLEIS